LGVDGLMILLLLLLLLLLLSLCLGRFWAVGFLGFTSPVLDTPVVVAAAAAVYFWAVAAMGWLAFTWDLGTHESCPSGVDINIMLLIHKK
jgi:hypothetical protein